MDYRKVVEYIVDSYKEGRLITALEACCKFGCSVSSLRKYIAKLKKSEDEKDIILYNSYLDVSNSNRLNGCISGGRKGRRNSTLPDSIVHDLCEYIVDNDCTLRQLEKVTGIPRATLYENLSKLNDPRLQAIYDEHRHNSSNDYFNVDNGYESHSAGSEISRRVAKSRK